MNYMIKLFNPDAARILDTTGFKNVVIKSFGYETYFKVIANIETEVFLGLGDLIPLQIIKAELARFSNSQKIEV